MYEMHYTGCGYPTMKEIEIKAKENGFTHSYWASEYGYKAMYNGDTVVVYDSLEGMSESIRQDAVKYGKVIE